MPSRRARTSRWRQTVASELNLLPLMNVFIVLIPLLLLSAVFVEVTVIRMDGTGGTASAAETTPIDLTVRFDADAYTVLAQGGVARTVARAGDGVAPDAAALAELGAALGEIRTAYDSDDPSITLIAAETTRYEELVAVMDAARAQGLSQAGLVGAAAGGF